MQNLTPAPLVNQGDARVRIAIGIGGILAVILGLFIVFYPASTGVAAMKVIAGAVGVYAVIVGAVYAGVAIFGKAMTGWNRTGPILVGVLYIIGGVIVLFNVAVAGAALAVLLSLLLGVLWIVEGVLTFVGVSRGGGSMWRVIFGVVSVVAGATLVVTPLVGFVTMWWLLGVSLIVLGILQVVRAVHRGGSSKATSVS